MSIVIKEPKRGQSIEDRDNAVVECRILNAFDVGIYFRIKRALETSDGLEFYIDDKDPRVLESLNRLQACSFITVS